MIGPRRAIAQTFEEAAAKMRRRTRQDAESAVQQRREDVGCTLPGRIDGRTGETCEQRRAHKYGIDPRDVSDPTDWNARTIDGPSTGAQC